MSQPARSRRLIALLAAYVVALQALLLPLTVAVGASFSGSLCTAAAFTEGSVPPASHDTGCPCAAGCGMQCCAQTLAVPPQAEFAVARTSVAATAPEIPAVAIVRPPDHRRQRARAPPLA